MKGFRKVGIVLSVACAISATLGICISQASTDVVWVQPLGNTSGEFTSDGGYVAESFIATADTITTASFFCGKERPTGSYYGYINTNPNPGGTSAFGSSAGKKYQDIVFNFNVGVIRGQQYYFVVQHTGGGSPQGIEYYYREGTAYSWGSFYLSGTQDMTKDLCFRVVGVNRIPQTFFGVNAYIGLSWWIPRARQNTIMDTLSRAGITLNREQIPWFLNQCDTRPNSYSWDSTDRAVAATARKDMPLLFNHFGFTPRWASSWDSTDYPNDSVRWRSAPPRNLDADTGGGTNYFYNYMKELACRYGPGHGQHRGLFWDSTALGESLVNENHYHPVRDWEINNEVNLPGYTEFWDLWWQGHYYDLPLYTYDDQGRAALYETACHVAWDAIKTSGIDPGARIYTNAVDFINDNCNPTGKQWLQWFYSHGGKSYTDVITWHSYQPDNVNQQPYNHKFHPDRFQMDYDTLRMYLALPSINDSFRTVWDDEIGWSSGNPNVRADNVTQAKQADIGVQLSTTGLSQLTNPRGPLGNISWFAGFDWTDDSTKTLPMSGLIKFPDPSVINKPTDWAFKQMTGKLKGLYFNRQVPLGNPSDSVYCYEFQIPGSDTTRKTWVIWRSGPYEQPLPESLAVRSTQYDSFGIAYDGNPKIHLGIPVTWSSGRIPVLADSTPQYLTESGTKSRPDVIVDSVWIYPTNPRAGAGVNFYARIKNIGNAALDSTLADTVTFQIDGVTQIKFRARRGLKPLGDSLDTLTVRNPNPYFDWTANYGDHLIRAWADSAACFVELRTDNNTGYIFKHVPPSGYINIPGTGYPNGRKFSNTRFKTLTLLGNGGTSPAPSQMKIKNSWGNWTSWQTYSQSLADTLPTTDGLYKVQAEFKMATGETSAIAIDSIILDMTYPVALISSPANKATVSGTVPFYGIANDSGYPPRYFRIDTLRYYLNSSTHDTIHVSGAPVGSKDKQVVTGLLGNWNTTLILNGWTAETLAVWDSAGNRSVAWESLYVFNKYQGGAGFASGFGSTPSLTMNVATDPGGNVYVAETQGSKLRKFSPHQDSLFAFSAKRGSDSTGTSWATAMITKDSTTIWIADGYAHAIKRFDLQGNLLLRFGSFGTGQGLFRQPCGIVLDSKSRLWVVDRLNYRVQVFDSTGHFLFKFGSQGTDSGKFNSPTGIAITKQDTLSGIAQDLIWVSDTRNNRVQVFDSLGNWVKTISQVDSLGLDTPLGICSDRYGDVFIADARHNRIVELNPFGQRILDFGGQGDSLCQFQTPVGVASSPGAHYLYVADMGNKRVQRFWVIQGDSTGGGGPQSNGGVRLPPKVYFLNQSYPNPTTGEALIEYGLPKESEVRLAIYNVAGQVVKDYNLGKQKAWYYSIKWDGRSNYGHKVGCGVYFYRLKAGDWVKTRKMVVVR